MMTVLYGNHPYGRMMSDQTEIIKLLSPADIALFYQRQCLQRERSVFGICGDIDAKLGEKVINEIITAIPWASAAAPANVALPDFPQQSSTHRIHVPREQAVIIYAFPGCDNLHSEQVIALELLFAAESNQASTLFKSIREKAGLAYYTGMTGSFGLHPGYLAFYAGTAPQHAEQVMQLLEQEQQRLLTKGLSEAEFSATRECQFFAAAKALQNPGGLLIESCLAEYYGNSFTRPWDLADDYAALQLDNVNRIIAEFLQQPGTFTIASPDSEKS